MSALYYSFSQYLRETFGCRVKKISVDAGFTCPNRDGLAGTGGCVYCNNAGFAPSVRRRTASVKEQLAPAIQRALLRDPQKRFLAYFQPYTNTYAPVGVLKSLYEDALAFPEVIGLCVGTRPDCVSDDVADLLGTIAHRTEIWLELGLQSAHNTTLQHINRGHSFEDFVEAVRRVKDKGIRVCVHIILGLPGESREMMLETVRIVAAMGLDGIKFHALYVLTDTPLESLYKAGGVRLLDENEYVRLVVDALEILPPSVVIQRLAADAPPEFLVAPEWCLRKSLTLTKIREELLRRGSAQGTRLAKSL